MAVASGVAAPALPAASQRWRSRPAQVLGVLLLMLLCYAVASGDYPWPSGARVVGAAGRARRLPGLADRPALGTDPNFIFSILDAFRAVAEWTVNAFTDALLWMTWLGVTVTGTLIVARFGGRRAWLIVLAAFASFALMGLWEPSIQTLALMFAAVSFSLGGRRPGRHLGRPQRPRAPDDHARARRDADHPGLRVSDAGRDPVLGRAGRGGDLHDDLRDPARGPHHRARHPRRHRGHRGGRERAGRDAGADALQGAAPARAPPAAALGQPDDHVRALARGHRGPDRRPRASATSSRTGSTRTPRSRCWPAPRS